MLSSMTACRGHRKDEVVSSSLRTQVGYFNQRPSTKNVDRLDRSVINNGNGFMYTLIYYMCTTELKLTDIIKWYVLYKSN